MHKLLVVPLILVLSACGTTGRIGELPTVSDSTNAPKVVTVRVSSIVGAANSYTVALDGKDLYRIGSGEHAEFLIPDGEHSIQVKCFGGFTPTWKEDSVKFIAKNSQDSYFVISPTIQCADIKPIEEAEGKKLLQGSKALNLEKDVSK